jgi:hypothetical protein
MSLIQKLKREVESIRREKNFIIREMEATIDRQEETIKQLADKLIQFRDRYTLYRIPFLDNANYVWRMGSGERVGRFLLLDITALDPQIDFLVNPDTRLVKNTEAHLFAEQLRPLVGATLAESQDLEPFVREIESFQGVVDRLRA